MQTGKQYLRPPFILSRIINPVIISFGLLPILTVKGRVSGKWIKVPVTPLTYENDTYLVAPRGETQWARNLRKNPDGRLTIKGTTRNFTAKEISGSLQKKVVAEYQKKVPAVKSQFTELPNPSSHPTFKLGFSS